MTSSSYYTCIHNTWWLLRSVANCYANGGCLVQEQPSSLDCPFPAWSYVLGSNYSRIILPFQSFTRLLFTEMRDISTEVYSADFHVQQRSDLSSLTQGENESRDFILFTPGKKASFVFCIYSIYILRFNMRGKSDFTS